MLVRFDAPKVAMSVVAFGTVCGLQFAAVFQSPLVGFLAQVALPAKELIASRLGRKSAAPKALKRLALQQMRATRSEWIWIEFIWRFSR